MAGVGIGFRPLVEEDLSTLVGWFAEPEIARWWNQPANLEAVAAKYLPRISGHEPTRMWIAEIDWEPAGLLQSYRHSDYPEHDASVGIPDAVGIDYFLGRSQRGRGLGGLALARFAAWVFGLYPNAECCVATPAQANDASWRALERAGFIRRHECQPPDEPRWPAQPGDSTRQDRPGRLGDGQVMARLVRRSLPNRLSRVAR